MGNLVSTGLFTLGGTSLAPGRSLLGGDLGIGAHALLALFTLGRVGGRSRGLGSRVGSSLGRVVSVSSGGESSVGDADVSDVGRGGSNDAGGLSRNGGDRSEELRHVEEDIKVVLQSGQ